jgi:hypothetical protein
MPLYTRHCEPYPFSNDSWSKETVRSLDIAVASQNDYSRKVGLVIGAGSMPYIAPHLDLDEVYFADRRHKVMAGAIGRLLMMSEHDHWAVYRAAVSATLNTKDDTAYGIEWINTRILRRGFNETKAAVAGMAVHGLPGDIRESAPQLGRDLALGKATVSFVNFTNVASYLESKIEDGRTQLKETVLDVLPMAPDAIIVDSGYLCNSTIYRLAEYGSEVPAVR